MDLRAGYVEVSIHVRRVKSDGGKPESGYDEQAARKLPRGTGSEAPGKQQCGKGDEQGLGEKRPVHDRVAGAEASLAKIADEAGAHAVMTGPAEPGRLFADKKLQAAESAPGPDAVAQAWSAGIPRLKLETSGTRLPKVCGSLRAQRPGQICTSSC